MCPPIYFTFLLNLEDSTRSGLADRGDGSIQENPNKGSEPEMTELETVGEGGHELIYLTRIEDSCKAERK